MELAEVNWDTLTRTQRLQYIRALEKNVSCSECGGRLVVHLNRIWMHHELNCKWRNYVRLVRRTSSTARGVAA
jgi:hypothetical protein